MVPHGAAVVCRGRAAARIATEHVTVLILGESGTGKELVARAIYHHSDRADKPLCAKPHSSPPAAAARLAVAIEPSPTAPTRCSESMACQASHDYCCLLPLLHRPGSENAMHATLILTNPEADSLQKYLLEEFPVVLGRGEDADVRVCDRWVSRRHCIIDANHGLIIVEDLHTSNGTFINGCRVLRAPLMPGDHLAIGTRLFRIAYEPLALEPPPSTIYHRRPRQPPEDNAMSQWLT